MTGSSKWCSESETSHAATIEPNAIPDAADELEAISPRLSNPPG